MSTTVERDLETLVPDENASLDDWSRCIEHWAREKGWWEDGASFGDKIAMCHTELTEAIEAYRVSGYEDITETATDENPIPKPEGVGAELADELIRVLHLMWEKGFDPGYEVRRKMIYNYTRAFRHGNRAL